MINRITPHQITTVFSLLEREHKPTMLEELGHYTPFQMLVMTLLSARAKDSTTIPIVREMFKHYPAPADFVKLPQEQLEKMIYKIGFFRAKAKHVKELSKILIEKFESIVPDTFEELTSLPGVGRKTANCILAYTFQKPAIAVDIHVHRIANRLGWLKTIKPEETEEELKKMIPREEWINVNRLFVGHGQTICLPRNPKCGICPILKYCEFGKRRKDKELD
ncbi:endonuclease III [Candidatus Woesearchaeota archaeon]|nr:endonuclease III [Candidatus Woesearchaeota archaeon]